LTTWPSAKCQPFGWSWKTWHVADGHVVKLELLPADQPYGRNSNGQMTITVSNLRLRLPVLEAPDGMTIDPPSGKVVPPGYALAADVPNVIDDTCPLAVGNLHVTRAKVTAQSASGGNGSLRVSGDFSTPPAFDFPPPFTVRVQDAGTLDRSHLFTSCTTKAGRIRCRDSATDGQFKATIKPRRNSATTRFKIGFQRQAISGPFTAPVTVTITHDAGVVRSDSIASCQPAGRGIKCREP